jgi:hypothetical protein
MMARTETVALQRALVARFYQYFRRRWQQEAVSGHQQRQTGGMSSHWVILLFFPECSIVIFSTTFRYVFITVFFPIPNRTIYT